MTTLARHVAMGIIFGALFGAAYFFIEPVHTFHGRSVFLGVPFARMLSIYLAFGVATGAIAGVVLGSAGAVTGRFRELPQYLAIYVAGSVALLALMLRLQASTVAHLKTIVRSSELVWVAAIFLAGVALWVIISRLCMKAGWTEVKPRILGALALVAVAVTVSAHAIASRQENHLPTRSDPTDDRPNVVFILLDALRPDHMSAYGYHRETTPAMDRMAREGVIFSNVVSHGNRTILSMPAVFTSLYPSINGAIGRGQLMRPLPERWTTIAEMLQQRGYTTTAVMSNIFLKSLFGMTQGFDGTEEMLRGRYQLGLMKLLRKLGFIDAPEFNASGPSAAAVTDAALHWFEKIRNRPFFLYVHYMDAHHPYIPSKEYEAMFGPAEPDAASMFRKTSQLVKLEQPIDLDHNELQKLKDYYDASIRYADDQISRLLDAVRELSSERETIVIITSDHGDEFMEHGRLYHTNLLIEELIRVPLIVWAPKRFGPGTTVDGLARHIDLLPTIAELTGAEIPEEAMGTSLVPRMKGDVSGSSVRSFAEGDYCVSLTEGGWKMMRVDSTDAYHLYDLSSVEGEHRDVAALRPEKFAELKETLDTYLQEIETIEHQRQTHLLDPDSIKELRDLGYIK